MNELEKQGIKISMDGKSCWMDNVFIQPLWQSLKYECIYLNAFDIIREASDGVDRWMNYYNRERPHSSLNDQTLSEMYQRLAA